MKELSIEQKAKAYDEAKRRGLDYIRLTPATELVTRQSILEHIFPELKESKGEKIRKRIIDALHGDVLEMSEIKDATTWLEKQGNLMKALQISNARIGELIEKNYYLKEQLEKQGNNMGISEVTKQELEDNLNKALKKETPESCNEFLEKQGEKTSDKIIKKARTEKQRVLLTETDGSANIDWDCRSLDDVKILLKCGLEFIRTIEANKQILTDNRFGGCSFRVPTRYDKGIKQGEQKPIKEHNACEFCEDKYGCVNPCSMKLIEEEKPTDKIESRQEELTEFEKAVKQVMEEAIECGDTHNLKADADMLLRLVRKPAACGEEDIELLDNTIKFIEDRVAATSPSLRTYSPTLTGKEIPFLKSLKDRVQPKQEWSEEDNRMCKAIIDNIQAICEEGYFVGNIDSDELIKWLKSLKERYVWKPSDEQIQTLEFIVEYHAFANGDRRKDIVALLSDLKKLREE